MVNPRNAAEYRQGETIGNRFTVLERLGSGGTGEVYRVTDETTGGIYALKSFFASVIPGHVQPHQIKNFLSPLVPKVAGVCQPRFFGEDRDRKYMVTDLVPGAGLRAFMARRKAEAQGFSLHEGAAIVAAVAEVLAKLPPFTVHGNIKPENILLVGTDLKAAGHRLPVADLRVGITDFGLTRVIAFSKFASIQLSQGDAYAYLSPEHIAFGGRVDQKADVFALGVLFYELLAGKTPKKLFRPLSALDPRFPAAVDGFLNRALDSDAARRPEGFAAVKAEMAEFLKLPDVEGPDAEDAPAPRATAPAEGVAETAPAPATPRTGGGFTPDDLLTDEIHETLEALAYPDAARELKNRRAGDLTMPTPDLKSNRERRPEPPAPARPEPTPPAAPIEETVAPVAVEPELPVASVSTTEPIDAPPARATSLPRPPEPFFAAAPEPRGLSAPETKTESPVRGAAKIDLQKEILAGAPGEFAAWLGKREEASPRRSAPPEPPRPPRETPPPPEPAASPRETGPTVFTRLPAGADFFAETGIDRQPPRPARPEPSRPREAAVKAERAFDPIGERSSDRPSDHSADFRARDAEDEVIDEGDEELQALKKMFLEAEEEADKRDEARKRRMAAPPTLPKAPSPQAPAAADAGDEAFPPLETDTMPAPKAPARPPKPVPGPAAPPPMDDDFPTPRPAPKRPPIAPAPRASRGRRKRHRDSGPFPKIIAGLVVLILLLIAVFVIYRVKTSPDTGVVKPEDQQPSAADLMGKVGRVDEPLPSSASPAASPADAAQPGGTGAPTLDPELQEILGLQDAATDSRGVPELRAKAEELMKTNQFFTPAAPNNAVYLLQQILKKDPGNEFGKKGLAEIGTKYANLAQMEIQAKRLAKAKDYIDKALVAQPDNLDYQDLARKLGASVRGGATEVSCPDDMVFVGAGPFPLGSLDPQKMYGEKAAMEVYVQAYCVDLYEYPNKAGQTPKAQVTFHEAQTICQTQGKRLCAEEEWEKACKGGGNLAFPYGTTWIDTACNTEDAQGADRRIAAAGAFPQCRTSEGVFDLSGNLKEWTSSLYAPGASEFTIRGGGYRSPGKAARCSVRESGNPTIKNTLTGFRCCKSMGQATK